MLKPENIYHTTQLDTEFAKDLKAVKSPELFEKFIQNWDYWLDEETRKLTKEDWGWMKPLIKDCRNERVSPEKKHEPANALLLPERIFKISIFAMQFKVPWGCVYIRMKEEGKIDY
jgi:hypothetical protein